MMPGETPWHALGDLSAPARAALDTNPHAYTLLVVHGDTHTGHRELLSRLTPADVLTSPANDPREVHSLLAGLWLWHDCLDESHTISQSLPSATGSFWHGIMHRREGDFSNARYWFARCRHHPALARIAALVRSELGDRASTAPLHRLVEGEWQPDAFVDVVEAVHRNPADPLHPVAVRLQQLEWRGLFEHCLAQATGRR
jgi:hypothetical protein